MSSCVIIRMARRVISIVDMCLFLSYEIGLCARNKMFFLVACHVDYWTPICPPLPLPMGAERMSVVITDKQAR